MISLPVAAALEDRCPHLFPEGLPVLFSLNELPDMYRRADGKVFWQLDLTRLSDAQQAALRECATDVPTEPSSLIDCGVDYLGVSNACVPVPVWESVIVDLLVERLKVIQSSKPPLPAG